MDMDLTGKVALVTGSTKGIGLATAIGLARMGASVIVNGRTEAAVAEATEKIKGAVPAAKTQSAAIDLSTAEGCAAIVQRFPAVDILVNNLGIYEPKPFFDTPDEDWRTNVRGQRDERRAPARYLKGCSTPRSAAACCSCRASRSSSSRRRWFAQLIEIGAARAGGAEMTGTRLRSTGAAGAGRVECSWSYWRRARGTQGRRRRIWQRGHFTERGRRRCCSRYADPGRDRQPDLLCFVPRHPARPMAQRCAPIAAS